MDSLVIKALTFTFPFQDRFTLLLFGQVSCALLPDLQPILPFLTLFSWDGSPNCFSASPTLQVFIALWVNCFALLCLLCWFKMFSVHSLSFFIPPWSWRFIFPRDSHNDWQRGWSGRCDWVIKALALFMVMWCMSDPFQKDFQLWLRQPLEVGQIRR